MMNTTSAPPLAPPAPVLTPTLEEKIFAAQRSHQDMAQSQQYFPVTSNALVLLNGGASVALLSIYQTIATTAAHHFNIYFLLAQISYVAGAISAVLAVYSLRRAITLWSLIWEAVALEQCLSFSSENNPQI